MMYGSFVLAMYMILTFAIPSTTVRLYGSHCPTHQPGPSSHHCSPGQSLYSWQSDMAALEH